MALARESTIPEDVLDTLDGLLDYEEDKRARAVVRIIRYVDSLSADHEPART